MADVKAFAFSNTVPELPYHDYGIYNTSDGRGKDLLICDSDSTKSPLYLARVSLKVKRKEGPHLTLYSVRHVSMDPELMADGTKLKSKQAKAGEVVGVAYYPARSKKIQLGVGSPHTPDSVRWETIHVPKIAVHEFTMLGGSPGGEEYANPFSDRFEKAEESPQDEIKYQWRHTHTTVEVLGKTVEARKKLVNEEGDVVALFIPDGWKGLSVTGTLRIFKDQFGGSKNAVTGIDKDAEIQVILSRCAIVEKLRR